MTQKNSKKVVHRGVKYSSKFISAPEAGKLFSYTPDYITKLAREGKIDATRVGNRWHVNKDSVQHFIEENNKRKKRLHEEIRQERLREQKHYARKASPRTGDARTALTQTFAILAIGLLIGLGGYTFKSIDAQEANVFSSFAKALYSFISPQQQQTVTQAENEEIEEDTTTVTTYTSLIIAPDEVFTETQVAEVRQSFSDDVSISVDPEHPDTGIIIPHFKERDGTTYRFLIAPIQTQETNL